MAFPNNHLDLDTPFDGSGGPRQSGGGLRQASGGARPLSFLGLRINRKLAVAVTAAVGALLLLGADPLLSVGNAADRRVLKAETKTEGGNKGVPVPVPVRKAHPNEEANKEATNVAKEEKKCRAYRELVRRNFHHDGNKENEQAPLQQALAADRRRGFSSDYSPEALTFEIRSNRVRWNSEGLTRVFQNRGRSIHCFLARVAENMEPAFSTKLRIESGDVLRDRLTLGAALPHSTAADNAALLFPDFTFSSWPEVGDNNITRAVEDTRRGAENEGMPGTPAWLERRSDKAAWRGNLNDGGYRSTYAYLTETYPSLFDIRRIEYGGIPDANTGRIMSTTNRLSREEHCRYKFLVHFNGLNGRRYSSALKWKFLCGSLVFVQDNGEHGNNASPPLFVEWWNTQMKPNVHYVPFSTPEDLADKVKEYSRDLEKAQEVALRGYELASMAFDCVEMYAGLVLTEYAALVNGLEQETCTSVTTTTSSKGSGNVQQQQKNPPQFKSLQDLQREYGPNVCQ